MAAVVGADAFELLDVDGDLGEHAEHRAEWSELVPVTLVDGRVHDVITVNPERLRAALAKPARAPGSRWRPW